MTDLNRKFGEFVGKPVYYPRSETPEECPTMRILELEANNLGMGALFHAAGKPLGSQIFQDHIQSAGIPIVNVKLEDQGVQGWVIGAVDIG